MLMEVRNQIRVNFLSIKYALMRELLNKVTFISNIIFMILNNSCMIVEWIVLYSIRDNIGGYSFRQILLLWGLAAGVYGVAHFFFKKAFNLSETINSGKLDVFLVQPKNVLLSIISSDIEVSALGDMLFALIIFVISGFSVKGLLLFVLFSITGGLMLVALAVILHSLSFWFSNTEMISEVGVNLMVNFATYPDGIFKGITKILLFTIIPVGIANYIPIKIISNFNIWLFLINILVCVVLVILAFIIFYRGLKRYSSSNLMSARL